MIERLRGLLLVCALAALAADAWLAVRVFRARANPDGIAASLSERSPRAAGPPARALEDAADAHLMQGLEALNDASLAPVERVLAYRSRLSTAERLLVRSLLVRPAQASALSKLAAVRWELSPSPAGPAFARHLATIDVAARLAPTVPRVQQRLGRLLLELGQREPAVAYLRRAVELDPKLGAETVHMLRAQLVDAPQILEALPARPEVLVALEEPFFEEGAALAYLAALERALDDSRGAVDPLLLSAYGRTCLRVSDPVRLRDTLDRLGRLDRSEAEAQRLWQRSRAYLALDDATRALEDARRAQAEQPESVFFAEHVGDVALALGRHEGAVAALREALALVARRSGSPAARARLYRKIGQGEEERGRPRQAYDAYRIALQLDPRDAHARRRIDAMREVAGFRSSRP